MKRYALFILLLSVIFANARPPVIDYKSIHEWCTTYLPTDDTELNPLKEYLELGKEWAHNCANDPHFSDSAQGKKLLEAMQKNIEQCLHHDASKIAYEKLVLLIKYELSLNIDCRQKRMYKVLTMVYEGCLHCVLAKVPNER